MKWLFATEGALSERTLTHYQVFEEISRGGMVVVYRAVDTKLDREVAINPGL